jgi:predicted secreted protein
MQAAAASISAVVSGQRYVAEAPTIPATIVTCAGCGAPAVPDDADAVTCSFCGARVPLPPAVRSQAAATKAMSGSRSSTAAMIARLREQPHAATTNLATLIVTAFMFVAWPIGWGLVAARVLADGFQASDLFCLLSPFAAVLAGFFLARGRLADRGALQLLTLGFGALAPAVPGAPSRCRRCQGPLPDAGLGGVAHCRYCSAENIVGLDLRPTVDAARTEQATFDTALAARASEKRLWTSLTAVALVLLVAWVAGTVAYLRHMEHAPKHAPTHTAPTHAKPPPAKRSH